MNPFRWPREVYLFVRDIRRDLIDLYKFARRL